MNESATTQTQRMETPSIFFGLFSTQQKHTIEHREQDVKIILNQQHENSISTTGAPATAETISKWQACLQTVTPSHRERACCYSRTWKHLNRESQQNNGNTYEYPTNVQKHLNCESPRKMKTPESRIWGRFHRIYATRTGFTPPAPPPCPTFHILLIPAQGLLHPSRQLQILRGRP